MTWGGGNPHAVGDRGQRYEVTFGDDGTRKVIGWSATLEGARQFCMAVHAHPTWTAPEIWDRETQAKVV